MAEPLSAGLGILKSSWQAIEFARTAFHARDDARRLYDKVNRLYLLTERVDSIIREHNDPANEDIVSFVQSSLEASNHTLGELARRCRKLGEKGDLGLFSRFPGSISYSLSAPSIRNFEQQIQLSIISIQFALSLLDRDGKQDIERRTREIFTFIEDIIAHHPHTTQDGDVAQSDDTSSDVKPLQIHQEVVPNTVAGARLSTSSSSQTCTVDIDEDAGSPLAILRSQETRAWGEVQRTGDLSLGRRRMGSADSTTLIAAINEHSLATFQQLLDEGVNINGTDEKGLTPLMHTICQHSETCVDRTHFMHKLLQLRCDIDASVNGNTALHMAVRQKRLDAAEALLERGASIESCSPNTPLLLAVKHNRTAFVDLLVTHGADVHIRDEADWNLIHYAVWHKSVEVLIALLYKSKALDLKIDLDARNDVGWTPLMLLAERARSPEDIRLARILLNNGADVDAVDDSGNPALYYAIKLHSGSTERHKFVHFLVEEKKANKQLLPVKLLKQAMGRYPALKPSTKT